LNLHPCPFLWETAFPEQAKLALKFTCKPRLLRELIYIHNGLSTNFTTHCLCKQDVLSQNTTSPTGEGTVLVMWGTHSVPHITASYPPFRIHVYPSLRRQTCGEGDWGVRHKSRTTRINNAVVCYFKLGAIHSIFYLNFGRMDE